MLAQSDYGMCTEYFYIYIKSAMTYLIQREKKVCDSQSENNWDSDSVDFNYNKAMLSQHVIMLNVVDFDQSSKNAV